MAFIGAAATASADPKHHTARRSQPVSPTHAAPDITGTISAKPKPKPAMAPPIASQDDEALPTPFNLPTAPRSRMRLCGERWQRIKLAGQAADETWRDYATKCLAEKDGPETKAR